MIVADRENTFKKGQHVLDDILTKYIVKVRSILFTKPVIIFLLKSGHKTLKIIQNVYDINCLEARYKEAVLHSIFAIDYNGHNV